VEDIVTLNLDHQHHMHVMTIVQINKDS